MKINLNTKQYLSFRTDKLTLKLLNKYKNKTNACVDYELINTLSKYKKE